MKKKIKKDVAPTQSTTKQKTQDDRVLEARKLILTKYGANTVRMGKDLLVTNYGRIPTGSVALDFRIGGGLPIGRILHLAGDFSTGKSTITDHIAREAQNLCIEYDWIRRYVDRGVEKQETFTEVVDGLTVAFIDVEGTKDFDWMESIGVDVDNIIYVTPEGQEEAIDIMFNLQQAGINLIILDSIDAVIPVKEYRNENSEDSVQMGIKPKLNGVMVRKFTNYNNKLTREGKLPCTAILINQLRSKIGFNMGDPNFTGGGRAIDFYSSVVVWLRAGDTIKEGKGKDIKVIGKEIKFKITKNKTFAPNQTDSFDMYFTESGDIGKGHFDNAKSLILLAIEFDIVERAGAWYKYQGENVAQGLESLMEVVSSDEELFESIREEVFKYTSNDLYGDEENEDE